jgi:hypothetical protein
MLLFTLLLQIQGMINITNYEATSKLKIHSRYKSMDNVGITCEVERSENPSAFMPWLWTVKIDEPRIHPIVFESSSDIEYCISLPHF